MNLKKIISEELDRLDEMMGGTYRSNEDQMVLDELMKRDDWEIILNQGIRDIANLTPNQRRVIKNYKVYLYRINPLNKEKIKQWNLRYIKSEKGKDTKRKFYGNSVNQTEEEKIAAKKKRNHLQKMYSKKRPLAIARIKKYQKAYKSDPINKARRKMLESDPVKRERWNKARREKYQLRKQAVGDTPSMYQTQN